MNLRKWLEMFPPARRRKIMHDLAAAHGYSYQTIASWCNGTRQHTATDEAMRVTEVFTHHAVTRFDERPDVYGVGEDVYESMEAESAAE